MNGEFIHSNKITQEKIHVMKSFHYILLNELVNSYNESLFLNEILTFVKAWLCLVERLCFVVSLLSIVMRKETAAKQLFYLIVIHVRRTTVLILT